MLEIFLGHVNGDVGDSNRFQAAVSLALLATGIVSWVVLARLRRWDHYNTIHQKYGPRWNNGRGRITPEEAQLVVQLSTCYDMPLLMYYSISFALFKTYGIPSVSKILVATKEFSSASSVARRYADTDILVSTLMACPISGFKDPYFAAENKLQELGKPAEDPRAMIALARVNWLHSHYKISNEDYLYTLSVFIRQPIFWARKFGWRELSPLEEHCFFIYWAEIGRRMNIQNIPDTLEEFQAWSQQYEVSHMVPADTNYQTARHTLDELLAAVPEAFGLKAFAKTIAICLMDDIVREAMMLPQQSWLRRTSLNFAMSIVGTIQGWFLFPRRAPTFSVDTSIMTDSIPGIHCPRLYPRRFTSKPWYRQETTGFGFYWDKLLVAIGWFREMPGPHLQSAGYRLEEMGPIKFQNSGQEEVIKQAARLQGCPIVGPWSLPVKQQSEAAL